MAGRRAASYCSRAPRVRPAGAEQQHQAAAAPSRLRRSARRARRARIEDEERVRAQAVVDQLAGGPQVLRALRGDAAARRSRKDCEATHAAGAP